MKKIGKILKKLTIIGIIIYAVIVFVNQQKILNTYATNSRELDKKIAEANESKEELEKTKSNVNSNEYIEKKERERKALCDRIGFAPNFPHQTLPTVDGLT